MNGNVVVRQKVYQISDFRLKELLGIPKDEEIIDAQISARVGGTIILIKCDTREA